MFDCKRVIGASVFSGPRESPIFQRFRGIGPAVTPRSGLLAVLLPGGDPLNEFIFDSFFFSRNVV